MLPLPFQVTLVVEHRKILRLPQPSPTGYILIDLKLLFYPRFYLLLFLIDGQYFFPESLTISLDWERKMILTCGYSRSLLAL